jgi:predicted DNA-binding protein (MmcQ/YjbR family)
MPDPIRTVRAKLLEFALGLPEAHEDFPWGERVVKVNKKVFVFLGRDLDPHFGLSVKLPVSGKSALRMPFSEPSGYGLGKSGWVSAKLDDKSQASFDMLRGWVRESYCAVAPKGLADQITGAIDAKKAAKVAKAKLAENQRQKSKPAIRQSAAAVTANKRAAKR